MANNNVVDLNSVMSIIVYSPTIPCLKEPHFKYMDRKSMKVD